LKIFAVPVASLKEYAYDNTNYGLENLPVEEYRLKAEELQGPEEPILLEDPEDDEERDDFFDKAIRHPISFH